MSDLLAKRLKEYSIARHPFAPTFDTIVVFPVPDQHSAGDTFLPGGKLVKPETYKSSQKDNCMRGVLVAAGLGALDSLVSHGVELGHMVWCARFSPWKYEVGKDKDGQPIVFMFMADCDVKGSEELDEALRSGAAKVVRGEDGKHRLKIKNQERPRVDAQAFDR